MARKAKSPGTKGYFEALRKVFELQAAVLTGVLPHMGERGRNDEERIRAFLRGSLPRKYGVGTGFVASSDPNLPVSRQVDIVIYDDVNNAPLHPELAAHVFPVEMVYACIEIKGTFRHRDIAACIRNIASVRRLKSTKRYVTTQLVPVQGKAERFTTERRIVQGITAPRALVVAFDAVGWGSAESFARSWAKALAKGGAHIHGALVLSRGWFFWQVPYTAGEVRLKVFSNDALLRFHQNLLDSIQDLYMGPAYMEPYYDLPGAAQPNTIIASSTKLPEAM
jgi:hypothetical protein